MTRFAVYRNRAPLAPPTLLGYLAADSRADAERLGRIRWGCQTTRGGPWLT